MQFWRYIGRSEPSLISVPLNMFLPDHLVHAYLTFSVYLHSIGLYWAMYTGTILDLHPDVLSCFLIMIILAYKPKLYILNFASGYVPPNSHSFLSTIFMMPSHLETNTLSVMEEYDKSSQSVTGEPLLQVLSSSLDMVSYSWWRYWWTDLERSRISGSIPSSSRKISSNWSPVNTGATHGSILCQSHPENGRDCLESYWVGSSKKNVLGFQAIVLNGGYSPLENCWRNPTLIEKQRYAK